MKGEANKGINNPKEGKFINAFTTKQGILIIKKENCWI